MAENDDQHQLFSCGEVFPLPANPALSDEPAPAEAPNAAAPAGPGGTITDASEFAIVGIHSRPPQRELLVAPAPPGGQVNTVGIDLVPVACFGLASFLFEFDSSFVLPAAGKALPDLQKVRKANKDKLGRLPLLSLFGHADPVGKDEYNKQLSGRRARAIYGLLRHRASQWQLLMDEAFGGDDWNGRSLLEIARRHTGLPKSTSRKALIEAYMTSLFPEPLAADDFLGRGADAGGKADFQGCADFNPLLILSAAEMKTLAKAERDRLHLPDRRVLIFLFDAGIKLDPKLWPCPRASDSTAGCRERFFLDGDARRTPGAERREHRGPNDFTFACRFYDRIAQRSPCERLLDQFRIRLFDAKARPLPFAPWALIDSKRTRVGRTDSGAFLSFLAAQPPGTCVLKWSRPPQGAGPGLPDPSPDDPFEFSIDIHLGLGDSLDDMRKRLQNLAYVNGPQLEDDVRRFQQDYKARFPGITVNGLLDPPTIAAIREAHDVCELSEKGAARG